jgi:hypothetical protein
MDQTTARQAISLPALHGALAAKPGAPAMVARPSSRNFRFGRAADVLAHTGRRLAAIGRRVGQPVDTFSDAGVPSPEDIRARYQSGVFGVAEVPPSLRSLDRRW